MFIKIIIALVLLNFSINNARSDGLMPIYSDVDGIVIAYGFAPMGGDYGETMEDIPCVKDFNNKGEYVCAKADFIMLKDKHDKCKIYFYNYLFDGQNLDQEFTVVKNKPITKGELIAYSTNKEESKVQTANICKNR
jgi:hypothetical protein